MINNQHHLQEQSVCGSTISEFEQRVWMHHQHNDDGSTQYSAAYHLTGNTNIGRLVSSLSKLPQFVPSLDTYYRFDENAGLVKSHGNYATQTTNIEAVDSVEDAVLHLQNKQSTPIALDSQCPIQFTVYICAEKEVVLGVIAHQILHGEVSWKEAFEVLSTLYNHGLSTIEQQRPRPNPVGFTPLEKQPELSASCLPWIKRAVRDIELIQAGVSKGASHYLQASVPRKFVTSIQRESYENRIGRAMNDLEILSATAVMFADYVTQSNGLDKLDLFMPCDISQHAYEINGAMIESGLTQLTLRDSGSDLIGSVNEVMTQLSQAQQENVTQQACSEPAALVTWLVDPAEYLSLEGATVKKLPTAPLHPKFEISLAVGCNPQGDLSLELVTGATVSPHIGAYLFEQFIAYIDGKPITKPVVQTQSSQMSTLPIQSVDQVLSIEETILAEFRAALAIEHLAKDDDFFDFGGHSLIGTRVIGRLLKDHAIEVSIEDLFTYRTAKELAKRAKSSELTEKAPTSTSPSQSISQINSVAELILAEFKEALASDSMTVTDDFFDFGGHSLIATRVIGRLLTHHGIEISINDLFGHPTAQSLAQQAVASGEQQAVTEAPLTDIGSPLAPLSLAQNSLWKAIPKYAKFGLNTIFNLPFVLRFIDELDEEAFGKACRDLLVRHAGLRSHFYEDNGTPYQQVIEMSELDNYKWFWTSAECGTEDRDEFLKQEAIHPFDLAKELPLRVRFIRCRETGQQFLSFLFHHIVQDEWSVNLMMDELNLAYKLRVQGKAPVWRHEALPMHEYARMQRGSGAHQKHLDYWLNNLKDVPWSTPIFPKDHPLSAKADPNGAKGGWVIVEMEDEVRDGLYALAKQQSASLFNVVYAAISAALNTLGAPNKLIVGTSASGRHDVEYYDTIGYFTTVVAHLVNFDSANTVADLVAQVKNTINDSMPYGDIPIDLIEEGLVGGTPDVDGHMFEVFIQLHAKSKFSGAFELSNGDKINFQQVDSDRSESGLGLQFEVLEETVNDEQVLRVMMSYLTENYSQAQVKLLCDTLTALFAEFARSPKGEQVLSVIKDRAIESKTVE